MQSVMNHARNFNNLLIEVEAYGYTVDETIVLSSHNDLYFFRSWRHVECHHRVVAPFCNSRLLRKCQLPLNTVDCLITSYLACGTVVSPIDTTECHVKSYRWSKYTLFVRGKTNLPRIPTLKVGDVCPEFNIYDNRT
jgi:hypothetical protein